MSTGYDSLYELYNASDLSHRDFYETVALHYDSSLSFEAFRSAMRRRASREFEDTTNTYSVLTPTEQKLNAFVDANQVKGRKFVKDILNHRTLKGVFISDVHIPYTDWKALELASQITEDFNPDYVTGGNDVFDFQGYGRWNDSRSLASRLWESDIQNPLDAHGSYMNILHDCAPNALKEILMGNHDVRMFQHLRDSQTRTSMSEWTILHFVEALDQQGLLVSSLEEKPIYISDSLVLTHGIFASKNTGTTAKNTVEAYGTKQYADESGKYYSTIAGHDHRFYTIPSHGVVAYGNGCLCRTDMGYLKTPPDWQLGITLFYTNNDRTWAYPLIFQTYRGRLSCIWNDKEYSVKR